VTLYRVGVVKQASDEVTYVAVDGGMSTTRGHSSTARATAQSSPTATDEGGRRAYDVCGKHCESGDVLIEGVRLPEPRRGEPARRAATGAYTLSMGSNYNAVPRPRRCSSPTGTHACPQAARASTTSSGHEQAGLGSPPCRPTRPDPRVVLVSIAAAMWGLDG
jgi:diaminopimelate decarboxylase